MDGLSYFRSIPMITHNNVPKQDPEVKNHHNMIWVPERCARKGCAVGCNAKQLGKKLKTCNQCKVVMYCSPECQKADWKHHKVDCAHVAKLHLWGKTYKDFEQCPCSRCLDRVNNTAAKLHTDRCNICGSKKHLIKMPCCGVTLCDTERQGYQMMSYSREFCARSHTRYTMCGTHLQQGHAEEQAKHCTHCECNHDEWRDCGRCRWAVDNDAAFRWQASNGYNVMPSYTPKRGARMTYECDDCKGRIHPGMESHSTRNNADEGTQTYSCPKCSPIAGMM